MVFGPSFRRTAGFFAAGVLSLVLLSGCAPSTPTASSSTPAGSAHAASPASQSTPELPEGTAAIPAYSPLNLPNAYDFTQPAPERPAVDKTYFEDAAFVGDSRTDGFLIYSGIGRGKNLTSNGLSIFQLAEKKALTIDGETYTLLEALAMEEYGKVYLCLGVNELGIYNDEGFYQSYCQAIDAIRTIQPNAVIYIQGLIPLNEEVAAQVLKRDYLKNDHLRVYNDLMRRAAEEKQVVFLDLYTEFADENGQLPAEASKDGVHLAKEWCQQWLAYLQTHTVDPDTLYPNGAPIPEAPPAEEPSAPTPETEIRSVAS